MPRGLNHVGAVGLGGKVYCIGGFIEQNRTAAPDVSAYDQATDSWRKLPPLPEPLGFGFGRRTRRKIRAVGRRDA